MTLRFLPTCFGGYVMLVYCPEGAIHNPCTHSNFMMQCPFCQPVSTPYRAVLQHCKYQLFIQPIINFLLEQKLYILRERERKEQKRNRERGMRERERERGIVVDTAPYLSYSLSLSLSLPSPSPLLSSPSPSPSPSTSPSPSPSTHTWLYLVV